MRISVYITSYNQKHYLREAIESALGQTLKPCQIAIVDDHSSDGSQQLIAGFHSRYPDLITPIYHARNQGVAQSRIDALQAVTGDYVTYVDGDDRLLPTKLEREGQLLRSRPQAQIAFSNVYYIDDQGTRVGIWADKVKPPEGYIFAQTFGRDFPKGNLFRSELVDYPAWKRVGFHDPALGLYEDYDMRIRLTKSLHAAYCDELLSEYRLHWDGLSTARPVAHFEALNYIYHKNKSLLNDLGKAERLCVNRRFGEWTAKLAVRAAMDCLRQKRLLEAAQLLHDAMRYDPAVLCRPSVARTLAPGGARSRMASVRRACARIARKG